MNYDKEYKECTMFFANCLDTIAKKANDYATEEDVFSNFKKISNVCEVPVEKTFLMFMTVKIARIVELLGKEAKNESLQDSLMDLANYACLMKVYMEDKDGNKT